MTSIARSITGATPAAVGRRSPLRVAILATPRSGNTWLRTLLGTLYGLEHRVCDVPDDVRWNELPERCVIQLHWGFEPSLANELQRHNVRPVTIARHPLDVLISILHFSTTWPHTRLWYGGQGGTEDMLHGRLPTSPEFLEYSLGPRARALVSISTAWWQAADCLKLRYEDLVADTGTVLQRLTESLEPAMPEAISAAAAAHSLTTLRPLVQNQHYWMGAPGHWKRLVPAATAERIAQAYSDAMAQFAYDSHADALLTTAAAERNWFACELQTLREDLSVTRSQLLDARGRLRDSEAKFESVQQALARLEPLLELGPQSLRAAQRLHAAAANHPRLYSALLKCVRPFQRRAG